jgi:hypothetical protein
MRERWGTLSVRDHLDSRGLVGDLILYDRLVFPVPPDEDERVRWDGKGWGPDLLDVRLRQLGPDLAVEAPWDAKLRGEWRRTYEDLKHVGADPFQSTRIVLSMQKPLKLPDGVTEVTPVAAYHSEGELRQDFVVGDKDEAKGGEGQLGLLLANRFVVPKIRNVDEALFVAVGLARDEDFKRKRRAFYDWQEKTIDRIAKKRMLPENAGEEMKQLLEEYNGCVRAAARKTTYKLAFTLAGIGLSFAAAPFAPLALAGAFVGLVQFATIDLRPVVEPGEAAPAAMFQDVRRALDRSKKGRLVRRVGL